MLKTVLARRQWVVICVDGLDESLPDNRTGLLKALREIIRELPNVRLFLTARPFILDEIKRYFTDMDTISVTPSKDVKILLKTKLEEDTEPDNMDDVLREQIMEIIPKKVSEIFLLVSLTIEAILGETTIHRRKEKLKQMTNGRDVGDVYTATLDRIKAQKKDRARLGLEAIMWISHSERGLRPEELCQALGVQPGLEDLNHENQPTIRTILSCGLGLITLDSSSATVRLVHFTLQEYIVANPTLFHSPHSLVAEVCLTYLNYQSIRDLSPTLSSPPPTTPFLEYASRYWGAHARRETNQSVKELAIRLLEQFETHVASALLLWNNPVYYWYMIPEHKRYMPLGFTGPHGAAVFGVQEIMIALLGTKDWDLNATDIFGNTVLSWAATTGDGGIVKMILERRDVNPDKANFDGRTPFSFAAEHGHEGIEFVPLDTHGIPRGFTGLHGAAFLGVQEIMIASLGIKDWDLNATDAHSNTALSWAVIAGHEGIVEMLLERNDVNPDMADSDGRTAPHFRIVELLLERNDVNPDTADDDGRTPFSFATEHGCEGVLELLLERNDVDPDRADNEGRTPFSWAAEWGYGGIVKMLLEGNDVDPDRADNKGRTPFSLAVKRGHVHVVKLLEERRNLIAK
ncbi:ankyrin [Choiromyces venosus 120613-1]|uniref:Ankyrin n=1 Tax=Choiromyces venosus 120613-1 TaxID=1336337 RepID=A0A3N4JLZ1_9PEZI|nr:ankyrin [Choiromyces venosus 120613-1]